MERADRDVDGYLDDLPDDVRDDLVELDRVIAEVMDGHEREIYEGTFWGGSEQTIIGYGRQSYQRSDKKSVEWFIVGLALQKRYISIYLSAVEGGQYVSEKYGATLGKVKVGKSVISFDGLASIDTDALAALVTRARDATTDPDR